MAIDGTYGLAWSEIAVAYASSQLNGDGRPQDVCPAAQHAAGQAIRAAPDLAEARFALAYVQWSCQWDWPAAEAGLRDVVELDPQGARAPLSLGHALSQTGRHEDAQVFARLAREREPSDPMSHALSSQIAFQGREPLAALEHADRSVAIDPEFWIGHMMRAQALEQLQRIDESLDAALSAQRSSGMNMNSKTLSIRGYALGRAGRTDEARQVLAALDAASGTRYVPPYAKALVMAGLRDGDAAFELLERAYEVRDVHLMYLTVDPKWDFLRDDARFHALLDRSGFR